MAIGNLMSNFGKLLGKWKIEYIFLLGNLFLHHKVLNNILNKVFWVNWFEIPACTLWSKIHLRCSVILCSLRTWGWGLSHNVAQWYYVPWGHWVQANQMISSKRNFGLDINQFFHQPSPPPQPLTLECTFKKAKTLVKILW